MPTILGAGLTGDGMKRLKSRRKDRGANLVEFALLMPLLILLALGVVEFGFLLGERNEIKHGAHEGARLAAVNNGSLMTNTCDSFVLHPRSDCVP